MDSGNNKPYTEIEDIRTFKGEKEEFVWHRDMEDRYITPLYDTDWLFQIDNQLPIRLFKDETVFIGKLIYHRLIPNSNGNELVMKIKKVTN